MVEPWRRDNVSERRTQRSPLPRRLANQKSYCNRRAAKRRQPPHHATLLLEFPSPVFPMMIRFSCRVIQSPAARLANKRLVEAAHGLGVEVLDRGLLPEAGIFQATSEPRVLTLDGLAVDEQSEPFLEWHRRDTGCRRCSSSAFAMPVRPSATRRSPIGCVSISDLSRMLAGCFTSCRHGRSDSRRSCRSAVVVAAADVGVMERHLVGPRIDALARPAAEISLVEAVPEDRGDRAVGRGAPLYDFVRFRRPDTAAALRRSRRRMEPGANSPFG